ncbi:MAG: hypothetical protein WDZ59_07400 [Pirellulales bacterium]
MAKPLPSGTGEMMDFEVQRCTRHCAATGRAFEPGEMFYSALLSEGKNVVRHDYGADSWNGPPEGALGWWKSRMPEKDAKRPTLAPNDVLLDLLDELADQPGSVDMRYVLSLLLVRRRVLRLEETEHDEEGREWTELYCPRRETTYRILATTPTPERAAEIQEELTKLLYSDAS